MQRCPYIHEMRERLLGQPQDTMVMESMERDGLIDGGRQSDGNQVGTVVKLNADGYGAHTSPTHQRTPLVPQDLGENFSLGHDDSILDLRRPKNAKTSLFIITSLVYAMLLIVVCIAYVISDVSTHKLPVMYYEGFFTYLYGISILFLLYVFCFLLQESTCCSGGKPKPVKEKKPKKQKPKKGDANESKDGKAGKDAAKGGKLSPFQEVLPKKKRDVVREQLALKDSTVEAEAATTPKNVRKRKTTQNDHNHGSFFLRIGAIAFGLGAMIYIGLEFGSFFEIPFDSPCHQILRGVNPLLQMIFTFMQMYFIFMNSRLNIHRFKVLARFGLMHIAATNICVWIRTLVLESLKEITTYHQRRGPIPEDGAILESIRQHALRNAGTVMGTHLAPENDWEPINTNMNFPESITGDIPNNILSRFVKSTMQGFVATMADTDPELVTTSTDVPFTTAATMATTTLVRKIKRMTTSTTTTTEAPATNFDMSTTNEVFTTKPSLLGGFFDLFASAATPIGVSTTTTTTQSPPWNNAFNFESSFQKLSDFSQNITKPVEQSTFESMDMLFPQPLTAGSTVGPNATSCGRVNIMGTIVQDSAPYLYPFIIEYSLIGAVVIYVLWKHIGRYPKYTTEEDLEHRLEVMLSRRAVAMAQVHSGRVDCVGASKGLFFGLLLLVGSLICLILFFVLVRHPQLSLLAIYLADVSHCALMAFSLFAIFIGFIRVQNLKFRCEEQTNLNDILLRISAFGLFTYSVFSVIAGSLNAMTSEPNLLVMITGILAVFQVVFQLLFIADVSRRRVHLPEHDRSKPGRQIVTFLLICNVSMFAIYTFEAQKVFANPVQLDFYGFLAWSIIQRVTLPLCIFHRFHSAVTLAEVWKTTYKARLE